MKNEKSADVEGISNWTASNVKDKQIVSVTSTEQNDAVRSTASWPIVGLTDYDIDGKT